MTMPLKKDGHPAAIPGPSPARRSLPALVCIGAVLLLLAAGAWLPFGFESPTLFYKFGLEKFLLRAGKIIGIFSLLFVFFQVVLISRIRILDRIFGLDRLAGAHRFFGAGLVLLVLAHPIAILGSEGFTLFPLEKRYWPQFLGIGLSLLIAGTAAVSFLRVRLGLPYHIWKSCHRLAAPLIISGAALHVFFVSEPFRSGLPHILLLAWTGACLFLMLMTRFRHRIPGLTPRFMIRSLAKTGKSALVVRLAPEGNRAMPFLPGQFVFLMPLAPGLPKEPHPFTIASSPATPGELEFIINPSGDWTGKLPRLRTGDRVLLDGPFGLFTYCRLPRDTPLLLLAGGIGITPMLSMLRFLADTEDPRPVFLVWSCQTPAHRVEPAVFDNLERQMQHLTVRYHYTREPSGPGRVGRLNRDSLAHMLASVDRACHCFVCGPPSFISGVGRDLRCLGFARRRIHWESFSF